MPVRVKDEYLKLLRDIYTNERTERGRRLGATLIEREMEYQVDTWNKDWVRKHPFPSYQWIEKELRKFKDPTQTPPEEQAAYATFSWPESMGDGGVPWAESRKALALLMYHNEKGLPRPSVGLVNRYWQVSYALPPDALVATKAGFAKHTVQADMAKDKVKAYHSIMARLMDYYGVKKYSPYTLMDSIEEGKG